MEGMEVDSLECAATVQPPLSSTVVSCSAGAVLTHAMPRLPTFVDILAGTSNLKRSNSAPMINTLVKTPPQATTVLTSCENATNVSSAQPSSSSSSCSGPAVHIERIRRYSTSSSGLHSPTTPVKVPSRLDQIKLEESVNLGDREAAHEREVQSSLMISHGWEELSLDEAMLTDIKRPRSFGEPLHIFTSPLPYFGSPSPTRGAAKQCFSPSLQQPVRNCMLTPTSTLSPTRKTFRRSLSPIITLRPSPLGPVKRKSESLPMTYVESMDCDRQDMMCSSPKRFRSSSPHPGHSTPERFPSLSFHPLVNSVSSTDEESLEQTVPSSSSSTTTTPRLASHSLFHSLGSAAASGLASPLPNDLPHELFLQSTTREPAAHAAHTAQVQSRAEQQQSAFNKVSCRRL